jgi:hypothetical protein
LNFGNAWYHSVQDLLTSRLLFKNLKIRIDETNFSCGFVWVWNLGSDIKGGTQTEGV